MYRSFGKRGLDLVLASAMLFALAPLIALTAILIWLEDRRPIVFTQERVGRDGQVFTLLKFRSMTSGSPTVASASAHELTVTSVGKIIRRISFDEVLQLVNVLRGEMSLVGPRPALPSQHDLIEARSDTTAIRCRPGMTGLAQIRAYDGMPAAEKAAFDGEYASAISLRSDLRLLSETLGYLRRPPPTY